MNNQIGQIEEMLKNLKHDSQMKPSQAFRTNARIRILNSVAQPTTTISPLPRGMTMVAFRLGFLSLFLLAGTVYAAQGSNPRDVLFPVKILSERVALTFSPTESAKTSVAVAIIDRRVQENEQAKKEGDQEEVQETVTNFESAVLQIRNTNRIDQDRVEEEIEKHASVIREDQQDDEEEDKENSRDVKGEQIQSSVTPTPTKKDDQGDKGSESSKEGDSGHDASDDSNEDD